MSLFTWFLFGLFVGIVANSIDPRPSEGGVFGAIILGVLGAIVGGVLANVVFGVEISEFNISSFAVAILGSLFLLLLARTFRNV